MPSSNSLDYRIKTGELPSPEVVKKYYIEENHTYKDSMEHFNMSKTTWENYTKKYNVKKGTSPIIQQKIKDNQNKTKKVEEKIEVEKDSSLEVEDICEVQTTTEENTEDKKEENEIFKNLTENEKNNKIKFKELLKKYNIETRDETRLSDYLEILTQALFELCYQNNIYFDSTTFISITSEDGYFINMPEIYTRTIENNINIADKTFFGQLKIDNFEKIYREDVSIVKLNEEDKKNRQQVMVIMGYDPFLEDNPEDRPQLYRDLTDLITESMRKDASKKKAAVEIVHNYLNISKYQKKLKYFIDSGKTNEVVQKSTDNILSTIAKIQNSINQTTKENGFSGGRSIGSNGRGMLSDVMNQVEEQGYDKGITNFYDIATSKSIQEISDISFKAMMNQVKFSATDYVDIMTRQTEIVRHSQKVTMEAEEALRICKEKITKQQLITELENEYRKKGISEEEIKEFINTEYDLFEDK